MDNVSEDNFKKIKKRNGEKFAQTLRNHHSGLMEIADLDKIVRHAGRGAEQAEDLLPYLMTLLHTANDNTPEQAPAPKDPFELLKQAGYNAFTADTLEKQNSIKRYFAPGELLCTFNDKARHENYHIIHAIHEEADQLKRKDFKGKEKRQDKYGTSVISIQIAKRGGMIKITNRYNHAVNNADNTFNSNPDNIIPGLSQALKDYFNIDFNAAKSPLPDDCIMVDGKIFRYNRELNNFFYGDQARVENGKIKEINKNREAMFDGFIFDNQSKILRKIDPANDDSFDEDFNRTYGGNKDLHVRKGNLYLGDQKLVGAEQSQIKSLYLPGLEHMSDYCLIHARALTQIVAPNLTSMGNECLHSARALTHFDAPSLTSMGNWCLHSARALTHFDAPSLTSMGNYCLKYAPALTQIVAPNLTSMGNYCLHKADALTQFIARNLTSMGNECLHSARALTHFDAPSLTSMGDWCLEHADALTHFDAPSLTSMGGCCLHYAPALTHFDAPSLTSMGGWCLHSARALTQFIARNLTSMGNECLEHADALTHFEAPNLPKEDRPRAIKTSTKALNGLTQSCRKVAQYLIKLASPDQSSQATEPSAPGP